jgi:hypothetical protein
MANRTPLRGAVASPRNKLVAAPQYKALAGAPPNFIQIPPFPLSDWGNASSPGVPGYGDCVTAEEAFAKTCGSPAILLSRDEVINWASVHNVLNGAQLDDVLEKMQNDGFYRNPIYFDDGEYVSVNWESSALLQSAITQGPVKLGVNADQLSRVWQNADHNGWFATGFHSNPNIDHCTSLCGYGTLAWLAQQLKAAVPAGVDGSEQGYAMFTWGTIGIIDTASVIAITGEAWLRQPTTIKRPAVAGPDTLSFIKTENAPSADVDLIVGQKL